MERRLSAILTADVVGYCRLIEPDEAATWRRSRSGVNVGQMALIMQNRMSELAESGATLELNTAALPHRHPHRLLHSRQFWHEDRMDYTIIGGVLNFVARLEQEAPPGTVLIS